jgi:hypothetical protein
MTRLGPQHSSPLCVVSDDPHVRELLEGLVPDEADMWKDLLAEWPIAGTLHPIQAAAGNGSKGNRALAAPGSENFSWLRASQEVVKPVISTCEDRHLFLVAASTLRKSDTLSSGVRCQRSDCQERS